MCYAVKWVVAFQLTDHPRNDTLLPERNQFSRDAFAVGWCDEQAFFDRLADTWPHARNWLRIFNPLTLPLLPMR